MLLRFIACENSVLSTLAFVPTSRCTILAHTLRHSAAELYRLVQGLEIGVIDCTRNCLDGAQIRLYGSAPQGTNVRAFVQHQQVACPPRLARAPQILVSIAVGTIAV